MDKKLEKQNGCLTSKSKKLTGFVLSLAISSSAAKEIIQFHFGHYLKKKCLTCHCHYVLRPAIIVEDGQLLSDLFLA